MGDKYYKSTRVRDKIPCFSRRLDKKRKTISPTTA